MSPKRITQSIIAVAVLAASLVSTGTAFAGADCSGAVTVQPGDTLSTIATMCGVPLDALQAANPGVSATPPAGTVLTIPTGPDPGQDYFIQGNFGQGDYGQGYNYGQGYYGSQSGAGTYVVQWGDTLGSIAARYGVSLNALMAANPQVRYPSLIYAGQVIYLPGAYAPSYYPPTYGPPSYYPPPYSQPSYSPPSGNGYIIWPPPFPIRNLKVTYKYGLTVRTEPSRYAGEIAGLYVSAVKGSVWQAVKSSTTVDREGFVWVQVLLPRTVAGYSMGWIVVKDGLGNYYTSPTIDE